MQFEKIRKRLRENRHKFTELENSNPKTFTDEEKIFIAYYRDTTMLLEEVEELIDIKEKNTKLRKKNQNLKQNLKFTQEDFEDAKERNEYLERENEGLEEKLSNLRVEYSKEITRQATETENYLLSWLGWVLVCILTIFCIVLTPTTEEENSICLRSSSNRTLLIENKK